MTYDLPYPVSVLDRFRLQNAETAQVLWAQTAQARLEELQELKAERDALPLRLRANRLQLGDNPAETITWSQADILRKMVKEGNGAASFQQLVGWTGIDNPHKLLKPLAEKYPKHIWRPGGPAKGGYRTAVVIDE